MTRPRLVVLGGAGMLGHKVFQTLRGRFPGTLATIRDPKLLPPLDGVPLLRGSDILLGVDVTEFEGLRRLLSAMAPEVVVNCAGIIKQRSAAASPVPSLMVNALLPHLLAETISKWGGRLIHFSTDCVFSGDRGDYREDDPSDARDLYGRTKYLGEVTAPNVLTLRTSIIGRELSRHKSLLDWFLSQEGRRVRGFTRVVYSGVTTVEIARVVAMVVESFPSLHGLYQVVSEPVTKFELLGLLREAYGMDVEIEPYDGEVSDRSMNGDRFHAATGWRAPSWPEMAKELAEDPTPYGEWGASAG